MFSWRTVPNEAIISVMLGVLASAIALPALMITNTPNGATCTFFDYGALGFGTATVMAGAFAVTNGVHGKDILSLVIGWLAILVGGFRVAYGLGLVLGPCS
jgi:uncharacterized membrane protein HdeD (DUF308 family)